MNNKKAQQELVGFVLIVVVVIIGMVVYLGITLRSNPVQEDSIQVSAILDAFLLQTSDCAIVYVPDYSDFEDLMKSAYKGDSCSNLNKKVLTYLNETVKDVLGAMIDTEGGRITAYELSLFEEEGVGIFQYFDGECSGQINSARRSIISEGKKLIVQLRVCL